MVAAMNMEAEKKYIICLLTDIMHYWSIGILGQFII